MIQTERLVLRAWRDTDRADFAALNADPRVGNWLGGTLDRAASDAMIDRINASIAANGFGFWAAERRSDGQLVGAIGIRRLEEAPGPGIEAGWRLAHAAWGQGYATEGARAALDWGLAHIETPEILAFTAASNLASQAVMRRIGMVPDPSRDFDHPRLAPDHPLNRHVMFTTRAPSL